MCNGGYRMDASLNHKTCTATPNIQAKDLLTTKTLAQHRLHTIWNLKLRMHHQTLMLLDKRYVQSTVTKGYKD